MAESTAEAGNAGSQWRRPMVPRDAEEPHRASTPLELLFDLCFVVAVAQAAGQLHVRYEQGRFASGLGGYAVVFFAIWWAWMNFTWFASAYDNDDVPYRLLTLVQIAGVLIVAAGVPRAMVRGDLTTLVVGYVVMRAPMVAQWLRAGRGDPARRAIAHRYATGVAVVQVCWVIRLALPKPWAAVAFGLLLVAELAVPLWAERAGEMTGWHPEHIAERYGLFTLIVLGECVAAATVALQSAISDHGLSAPLLTTAAGALVLLFALWWAYFKESADEGLRDGSSWIAFLWGYGHYLVFASLAALGAGLQVVAATLHRTTTAAGAAHSAPSDVQVALTVAVPVVIFLAVAGFLHFHVQGPLRLSVTSLCITAVAVLLAALLAGTVTLAGSIVAIAVVVASLVGFDVVLHERLGTA
jgi:low temperature requirement protein LtrA